MQQICTEITFVEVGSALLGYSYLHGVEAVISNIARTQMDAIGEAATSISDCLSQGGMLYLFGTGHSASVAVEPFHRAGGLVPVRPIVEQAMTLHGSPQKATALERLAGYADIILDDSGIRSGDSIIIISNSGINSVPIEMGLSARARGITVIAITSVKHSEREESRHPSCKRLFEVADIVIDNCGEPGDAMLETCACNIKIGPTSTLAGIAIVNAMSVEVIGKLHEMGIEPPVMMSSNMAGGDDYGAKWEKAYLDPEVARSLVNRRCPKR
ncbi:MAG TPA: SIS domain-containing protein [Firmicutes bacterium]|nr:SIS domain-containing protein [Bacillota bacterium]